MKYVVLHSRRNQVEISSLSSDRLCAQSSEIIRMFYTEFDDIIPEKYAKVDLFPENLRKQIEDTNEWTYNDINNGVYKSGFAT